MRTTFTSRSSPMRSVHPGAEPAADRRRPPSVRRLGRTLHRLEESLSGDPAGVPGPPPTASTPTASRSELGRARADDLIISGSSGAAIDMFALGVPVKEDQRVLHSGGLGAMGFGLPASIGACVEPAADARSASTAMGIPDEHPGAPDRRATRSSRSRSSSSTTWATPRSARARKLLQGNLVGADATSGLTLARLMKVAWLMASLRKNGKITENAGDLKARHSRGRLIVRGQCCARW